SAPTTSPRMMASPFDTFRTSPLSRRETSSFRIFWKMVLRFLLPLARPEGLPDCPGLKREWTGGRLYPTAVLDEVLGKVTTLLSVMMSSSVHDRDLDLRRS